DERFRCVYLSREWARLMDVSAEEVRRQIGKSLIVRALREDAEIIRVTPESGTAWFEHNAPIIRRHVHPDDDDFEQIFDATAPFAADVEPLEPAPRAWYDLVAYPANLRFRRTLVGDQHQLHLSINDDAGRFIGAVLLYRGMVPDSLLQRLGRGDPQLYTRMDRVSEPRRRDAAILFADLEASGVISKRLSSRGYFELIRDLTDLIDACVISHGGITGKHAGDGGSALFLAADFNDSESRAARAAIDTAQSIRDGAERLGPDVLEVKVNVGVHWGAQLMIGQVSTHGRLEVTALGDQMNEGARIETAATDGEILASKNLIERLDAHYARETKIDPDYIVYSTLSDLAGASDKAVRDAGTIAVARI
ncbi:MAG: adenylate/guanylate cyclase domain-containing protein, partial [Aeromicrobium sp.]